MRRRSQPPSWRRSARRHTGTATAWPPEARRRRAAFIKVMTTGARTVELEDPDPAQITAAEMAALVEETHRMGYRVSAHAEGLAGTEMAIEGGVDTIEHGMYLHRRPDLLEQ